MTPEAEDMLLDALRELLLSFRSDPAADEAGEGHDVQPVHIVLSA